MNEELRKEIFDYFKQKNIIYLATSKEDKPAVRPVTLIHFENEFFIATGGKDAKLDQIKANNNIEFCYSISNEKNSGYIRGFGIATIIDDIPTKQKIMDNIDFIKMFWTEVDDPGYTLLKIELKEIEYMKIGEMLANRFEL